MSLEVRGKLMPITRDSHVQEVSMNIFKNRQLSRCMMIPLILFFTLCTSLTYARDTMNKACKNWYVQNGASGVGTKNKPLGSLSEVEMLSKKCDKIFIVASQHPLDGGIVLKEKQKLIGLKNNKGQLPKLTNTIDSYPAHAIVLSKNNRVRNIHIEYPGNPGDPNGSAIFGDNVTGTKINNVVITKLGPLANGQIDTSLCNIARNSSGEFVAENSVLRGCRTTLSNVEGQPEVAYNSAILLLADSRVHDQVKHHLNKVIVFDAPDGTPINKVWFSGLTTISAGDVEMKVKVTNSYFEGSERGIFSWAFENSQHRIAIKHTSIDNTDNDALQVQTGFQCSGLPPGPTGNFLVNLICPNDPMPLSDSSMVVDLDGFVALQSLGSYGLGSAAGFEYIPNDQNRSRIEVHVQNSLMAGGDWGFLVFSPNGSPGEAIYDLGCVTPIAGEQTRNKAACKAAGYTSVGNNNIFNNITPIFGNGVTDFFNIFLSFQESGDNAVVMAQNNYWGDYDNDGLGDQLTPCVDLVPPFGAASRCVFEFDDGTSVVDDGFFLSEPND